MAQGGLKPTIGICEDDDQLRGVLRDALAQSGLGVRATAFGSEAVSVFSADPPDVLVLDIGLPDSDGRDVCQALRARGVATPVLFLTARGTLPDKLSGFQAGGDDFLAKPFAIAELLARVNALLRRAPDNAARPTTAPGFALDPAAHAIEHDGRQVRLTPTEFRLLAALAGDSGAVVRRQSLVSAGWPEGAIVHDNTIDAYVTRLRRKLREVGSDAEIENVRGVGYVLR